MGTEAYRKFFADFTDIVRRDAQSDAHSVTRQWEVFFDEFSKLRERDPEPDSVPGDPVKQIGIAEAERFFASFSGEYDAFLKTGMGVNLFDILLPDFDELAYSRILAWLLNCSGSHGQKDAFLRLLLDAVPEDFKNGRALFPESISENSRYSVKVEESYDEDGHKKKQRSRIDIELDGRDFLLFIEVKITAGETDDQLSRYERIFNLRRGLRPGGVIFLTPEGRSPGSERDRAVAPVSWRSLGRSFRERAGEMASGSHGQVLIRQFCDRICYF